MYAILYTSWKPGIQKSIPRDPRKLCIPKHTYQQCHGAVEGNFLYTQWSMGLASPSGKLTHMNKQKYICFMRQEWKQV